MEDNCLERAEARDLPSLEGRAGAPVLEARANWCLVWRLLPLEVAEETDGLSLEGLGLPWGRRCGGGWGDLGFFFFSCWVT